MKRLLNLDNLLIFHEFLKECTAFVIIDPHDSPHNVFAVIFVPVKITSNYIIISVLANYCFGEEPLQKGVVIIKNGFVENSTKTNDKECLAQEVFGGKELNVGLLEKVLYF